MKLLFKQLFSTINADEENCCDKKQANRTIESENVKESKENLTTKNGTIGRGRGGQKLFEKVSRDAATQIWEK
jgi:hypothetical protein